MARITGKTGVHGRRHKTSKTEEEKHNQRLALVENFLISQLNSSEPADSAKVTAARALYDKLKPSLSAVEQHTLQADVPTEEQLAQALGALVAQRPELVDHLIQIREQQRQAQANTTASSVTTQ